MTEFSGPVNKRPFTVGEWRHVIGNEPGIKEDVNGTAYDLAFSTNSDQAFLGSTSQDSVSVVAGGMHLIPVGVTHPVPVPAPVNAPRTDLIVVRNNPEWAAVPDGVSPATHVGPCRLHRIPGTEGSGVPPYDGGPPGPEDMVLWEVTRTPGTALSSSGTTRRDRRIRTGPNLYLNSTADLAVTVPIGTVAHIASGESYVRVLDGQGGTTWRTTRPVGPEQDVALDAALWNHDALDRLRYFRDGAVFTMTGGIINAQAGPLATTEAPVGSIPAMDAPSGRRIFPASARLTGNGAWVAANVVVNPDGTVRFNLSASTTNSGPAGSFILAVGSCTWRAKG